MSTLFPDIFDMGDRYRSTSRANIRLYLPTMTYVYRYRDRHGKWVERTGTKRLRDTADMQRAATDREAQIAAGTLREDAEQVRTESGRKLADVLDQFGDYLRKTKGTSKAHAATVVRYCERFGEAMGVAGLGGVTLDKVEAWLRTFDGARSHNYAMTSLKHLMTWADDRGKVAANPLRGKRLRKRDETKDRRRQSRALTPDQFAALLAAAPLHRRVFYLLAAHTGCRWRETARLWWDLVDLDARVLALPEAVTKTGEPADLPLTEAVVRELAAWYDLRQQRGRGGPRDLIFDRAPQLRSWRMDLVNADILTLKDPDRGKGKSDNGRYDLCNLDGYIDDLGRRLDRKCLRKSYGTWLAAMEPNQSKVQKLMRHRDPKMTGNLYTDPALLDLRRTIGGLDTISTPPPAKDAADTQANANRAAG